jgi:hypothetical protein
MVTNFVAIPIYLRYLGRAEYGLWMTVSGVILYLGLLNFGITQATENHFGAAVVRQNADEQNRVLSTGFWWYLTIVAGAILVLVAVEPLLPLHLLIKGADDLEQKTPLVFLVAAASYLIELPFRIFPGCLRNIGKIDVQQWLGGVQAIVKVVVAFVWLAMGGSIVGLIVAIAATNIAAYICSFLIMRRELPHLSLHVRHFHPAMRREMAGPSFFFLLQDRGRHRREHGRDGHLQPARHRTGDAVCDRLHRHDGHHDRYDHQHQLRPSFLRAHSQGATAELVVLFRSERCSSAWPGIGDYRRPRRGRPDRDSALGR